MITRVVMLKLRDGAPIAEIAAGARHYLSARVEPLRVTVGTPADEPSARSWDISFLIEFRDLAALEGWIADADHRDWLTRDILPHVEVRKVWNFESP